MPLEPTPAVPGALVAWLAIGCAERPLPPAGSPALGSAAPVAPLAPAPVPADQPAASPCEGARLDLLAAIADLRCRISEDEADALRAVLEDPARAPLSVAATALPDGRVQLQVRNTGSTPQSLPLLVHSGLDNFAVKAGTRALAAPVPDWPAGFSFEHGRMLSKVVLPPSGVALATLRIEPQLVSHEPAHCPPNAKCSELVVPAGRLPAGDTRLTIRTPLYSIRADLAAEVVWKAP